jgi:hypothetical protein
MQPLLLRPAPRSARNCVRRDQGNTPPGRRGNPGAGASGWVDGYAFALSVIGEVISSERTIGLTPHS